MCFKRPCQFALGRAASTVPYVPQEGHRELVEVGWAAAVVSAAAVVLVSLAYRPRDLLHRAFAAFAEIWERLRRLSFLARAWPPLRPPRRPRATAAGFLGGSAGGSYLGACPVDSSIIW